MNGNLNNACCDSDLNMVENNQNRVIDDCGCLCHIDLYISTSVYLMFKCFLINNVFISLGITCT